MAWSAPDNGTRIGYLGIFAALLVALGQQFDLLGLYGKKEDDTGALAYRASQLTASLKTIYSQLSGETWSRTTEDSVRTFTNEIQGKGLLQVLNKDCPRLPELFSTLQSVLADIRKSRVPVEYAKRIAQGVHDGHGDLTDDVFRFLVRNDSQVQEPVAQIKNEIERTLGKYGGTTSSDKRRDSQDKGKPFERVTSDNNGAHP